MKPLFVANVVSGVNQPMSLLKDVHTEHCCIIHKCKYAYDQFPEFGKECSVSSGKKPQSYPCESCYEAKQYGDARIEKLNGKLVKIPSFIQYTEKVMEFLKGMEFDSGLSPDYQVAAHELRQEYERNYK